MDALSLAALVKRVNEIGMADTAQTKQAAIELKSYLNDLLHNPDDIIGILEELAENKAEIIAETESYVLTVALLLEFMCAVTPDLLFVFDTTTTNNTIVEILREVSRAQHVVIPTPKLTGSMKDIPLTTFTIRSNNAVIILSRLEFLPSKNFDRKTSLAIDYIKYRGHERRLVALEEKVDRLIKQMYNMS